MRQKHLQLTDKERKKCAAYLRQQSDYYRQSSRAIVKSVSLPKKLVRDVQREQEYLGKCCLRVAEHLEIPDETLL